MPCVVVGHVALSRRGKWTQLYFKELQADLVRLLCLFHRLPLQPKHEPQCESVSHRNMTELSGPGTERMKCEINGRCELVSSSQLCLNGLGEVFVHDLKEEDWERTRAELSDLRRL